MSKKRVTISTLDRKLDRVLKQQKELLKDHDMIERAEAELLKKEVEELSGLEKLKSIQRRLQRSVEPHPLRRRELAVVDHFMSVSLR